MITLTEENYLKAILSVSMTTNEKVSTNAIAEEINTTAASVSDMLKKLEEKKLIKYAKYKGVKLSKKGKSLAISVIRKHRLWETFLVKKLNFEWSEVHELAEQLEHIKSNELIDRLEKYLNYPKFDPHGEPIPTKKGDIPIAKNIPLNNLKYGEKGKIMGVSLDNKDFLDYLTQIKISIGTQVKVIEKIKFDQSMKVEYEGKSEHISKEIAENILIKTN